MFLVSFSFFFSFFSFIGFHGETPSFFLNETKRNNYFGFDFLKFLEIKFLEITLFTNTATKARQAFALISGANICTLAIILTWQQ